MAVAIAPHPTVGQPLGLRELLAQLKGETGALLRALGQLAGRELSERAGRVVPVVVLVGVAALAATLGALGLAVTAVLALMRVLPAWGAVLVVTAAALGGAAIAWVTARRRLRRLDLVPRETIHAIEKGMAWLDRLT